MKIFGEISEHELDRLFSGKAPAENSGLKDIASLVQKVQTTYLTNIEPDVEATHLAGLIEVVNLTDKGDLAARPASKVTGPHAQASGLPKRRRRFMLESLFATLTAKLAVGGIAIAMAATGAAATGHLPDQAQTGLSTAVEKIGIHIPLGDTAEEALERAEDAAEAAARAAEEALERAEDAAEAAARAAVEVTVEVDGDVDGDETNGPNENAAFGQSVAADARGDSDGEPGVDGQEISAAARAMAEERRAAGQAHRPEHAGPPADAGRPADAGSPGQTGLDRASQTPAAGHIPSSVPGGRPAGVGGGRP
jgi:hypothetical protein